MIKYSKWFIALGLLWFVFAATDIHRLLKISQGLEDFSDAYRVINNAYVDPTDPSELMRVAIDSMLAYCDPYTNYFSDSQMLGARLEAKGGWDGIGIDVSKRDSLFLIRDVMANSPASENRVQIGDRLLQIDGTPIEGKELEFISKSLKGKSGTKISIQIKQAKNGRIKDLELERIQIEKENVPYYGMIDSSTGYIVLTTFTQNAAANISKAFDALQEQNDLKYLILDLRDNGGGFLMEAVKICNLFTAQGIQIVSTKGRFASDNNRFKTMSKSSDETMRLAVLINGRSASASEIVSGALQDLDRAVLIGRSSFGKGLVQNMRDIGYNSKVKLTTAKYYIPSGRCVQALQYSKGKTKRNSLSERDTFYTRSGRMVFDGNGIEPDVSVNDPFKTDFIDLLNRNHLFFDFATLYHHRIDSISAAKEFAVSDSLLDEFKAFVLNRLQELKSKTEKKIDEYLADLTPGTESFVQLSEMNNIIQNWKVNKWDAERELIRRNLGLEIVRRYHFTEGKIENQLQNDPDVLRAIEVLSDSMYYHKTLGTHE